MGPQCLDSFDCPFAAYCGPDRVEAECPDLSYDSLDGVADGGMAVDAFKEAIASETAEERRAEIEGQLLAYCHLDTLAMVRLWELFRGKV